MDPNLYFEQTKLKLLNKKGILTPGDDGYYTLPLAGLNVWNNTRSWYYVAEGAKQLFGPGSLLHRKIANGCLRGEVDHPRPLPGQTEDEILNRYYHIDLKNVCCTIKAVWLDENYGKNNPHLKNDALIAVMGKVKPWGERKDALKEALDDPDQNVCFSMRTLADEKINRGRVERRVTEIVTFDFVNEGGILHASKWDSPAAEAISDRYRVTREKLSRISVPNKAAVGKPVFALESADTAQFLLARHFNQQPSVIERWI